ncbi:MAG: hypothetical protein WCC25_11980 [Candidatus Korobacteraceae bacterium]
MTLTEQFVPESSLGISMANSTRSPTSISESKWNEMPPAEMFVVLARYSPAGVFKVTCK